MPAPKEAPTPGRQNEGRCPNQHHALSPDSSPAVTEPAGHRVHQEPSTKPRNYTCFSLLFKLIFDKTLRKRHRNRSLRHLSKRQVDLVLRYSYLRVSTHVPSGESHLAPAKPEGITEFKFGDSRVYFQSFLIGGPSRETPPWKPTTQALDNLLCGTGAPRGAPEQGNSLNDLGRGQLAKGLGSYAAPSPPGTVLRQDPTDHGMESALPLHSSVPSRASPRPETAPACPASLSSNTTRSPLFREAVPEFLSQTQSLPFYSMISSQTPPGNLDLVLVRPRHGAGR